MTSDLLILSDIRFVREGLAAVLRRDGTFCEPSLAVDLEQARALVTRTPPRVILIDTAFPCGPAAVSTLRSCTRESKIVAFALTETEAAVIAWAQAGIDGYIPRDTGVEAMVGLLNGIVRGEQACSTRIAFGLLHWISAHSERRPGREVPNSHEGLTIREQEIVHLVGAGLSNKEIARNLGISLATTKTHVHNILTKLGVSKRSLAVMQPSAGRNSPA